MPAAFCTKATTWLPHRMLCNVHRQPVHSIKQQSTHTHSLTLEGALKYKNTRLFLYNYDVINIHIYIYVASSIPLARPLLCQNADEQLINVWVLDFCELTEKIRRMQHNAQTSGLLYFQCQPTAAQTY